MEIFKSLPEQTIDALSVTEGKGLDMTSYITSPLQAQAIMESYSLSCLGSRYVMERCDLMKRLTCSFQGRHRSDLVSVGSTPSMGAGFGDGS